MRILKIKLVNFIGVFAARGLKEIEYDFSEITKPIIQLYGKNRCGKTVLLQQLHPFSSINLNGDERSDLALILPGEVGIKEIIYEFNNKIYEICHTYKPNSTGTNHTVSSSIKVDGEELNASGGVGTFNTIINNIFGINKYSFELIINGTQLSSFASMSTVQRKNLLNKAMGIDIYDKIHKLSTEDYRYTNKLITSLNNTKEFILSTYGSYENLVTLLQTKQAEYDSVESSIGRLKTSIDKLTGKIDTLKNENIAHEISECERLFNLFEMVKSELGEINDNTYDMLVDEQIKLNSDISDAKNKHMSLMQRVDDLHARKHDIENTIANNQRMRNDYNNMIQLRDELQNKISRLDTSFEVFASSSYYSSMISIAKLINNMSREIMTSLNDKHLKLLTDMINKEIDVAAFIIQEGSLLMDSEKEKNVISRIQRMITTIDGEFYNDDTCNNIRNCVYWKTHDTLRKYFQSMQTSNDDSKFTQYDIEQFDYAYKQVLAIKKLISQSSIADDLGTIFNIKNIMNNINKGENGIDVTILTKVYESALNFENKEQLKNQLDDVNKRLKLMEEIVVKTDNVDELLQSINKQIDSINGDITKAKQEIDVLTNKLSTNDTKRMMLSEIKHIRLKDVTKKYEKLKEKQVQLFNSDNEYRSLILQYNDATNKFNMLKNELKAISDAHNQYIKTMDDINRFTNDDSMYRIIAEATSSTKGKPVLAIREEIERALFMTNRLLDIMFDGEIEMLSPVINENDFSLPFRSGSHTSKDIRYGSQSESSILSLALSLSLASSLTIDMVGLLDEIDAFTDAQFKDSYILMLSEIMTTLNIEQMFIISHNITPGQYENVVHVLNITGEDN